MPEPHLQAQVLEASHSLRKSASGRRVKQQKSSFFFRRCSVRKHVGDLLFVGFKHILGNFVYIDAVGEIGPARCAVLALPYQFASLQVIDTDKMAKIGLQRNFETTCIQFQGRRESNKITGSSKPLCISHCHYSEWISHPDRPAITPSQCAEPCEALWSSQDCDPLHQQLK